MGKTIRNQIKYSKQEVNKMSIILIIVLIVVLLQVGATTLLRGVREGAKRTIDYCKEHKDDKKK